MKARIQMKKEHEKKKPDIHIAKKQENKFASENPSKNHFWQLRTYSDIFHEHM